jgi:hypothetical protein
MWARLSALMSRAIIEAAHGLPSGPGIGHKVSSTST